MRIIYETWLHCPVCVTLIHGIALSGAGCVEAGLDLDIAVLFNCDVSFDTHQLYV